MELQFEKYHGLGNDFIMLDAEITAAAMSAAGTDLPALARRLCERRTGIGADGLITVGRTDDGMLQMVIHNSDGSYASMCGNGIRCFGAYALAHGFADDEEFPVITGAGLLSVKVLSKAPFTCEVYMGRPDFSPAAAGVAESAGDAPLLRYEANLRGYGKVLLSTVFIGTYHTVVWMDAVTGAPELDDEDCMRAFCRALQALPIFTEEQNINMCLLTGKGEIAMRTYERGAGLTDACGTGACAAAVIARADGKAGDEVVIHLRRGDLRVRQDGEDVYMSGPAERICCGTVAIDN